MKTVTVFDKLYARLNTKQKEAVDALEGPVMVIAGPGTGKTTILTLRIANILLKTDTPASGILALTFTDSGAKAMRTKLRETIGPRADEVRISTFHGFASSIIAEFGEHFPHLRLSEQLTDIEAEDIVRTILSDNTFSDLRPAGDAEYYVGKIIGAISEAKRDALTPDMLESFAKDEAKRIENDPDNISTRGETKGQLKAVVKKQLEKAGRTVLLSEVYRRYEAEKKKRRRMDFGDLLIELITALRNDELLLRLIQERYLYILVDEHQDTNDAQNEIVRLIANFFDNPNVFIVGDEKQAIYRFQGASVGNFLSLRKLWPSMQLISLEDNYRSHQGILDAGFSLIERNYEEGEHTDLRIKLRAGGTLSAREVEYVEAGNIEAAHQFLVDELKKFTELHQGKTAAVIVRKNSELARIAALCDESGLPAASERGSNIFDHPVGIVCFELLSYLADPSKTESLAFTVAGGLWGLPFERRAELLELLRSGKAGDVTKVLSGLRELFNALPLSGSLAYLTLAADRSGLTALASRDPLAMEVWRGILALAAELANRDALADSAQQLIKALLDYRTAAERRNVKVTAGDPAAPIRLVTAHSAKGLEYDWVFLPYATESAWLPRARGSVFLLPGVPDEGDDVRDARRLFYVAMTRARERLVLMTPLTDDAGKALMPVRFLGEIDPAQLAKIEVPATAPLLQKPRERELVEREALQSYAKRVLLERGLSVTALNHFMECANLFLYKSILRVPEPPSPSSERGNAMHEAMASAWRTEDRSEQSLRATFESTIVHYFNHSLLPKHEREASVKALLEDAPAVAKALAPHFAQEGVIRSETWSEAHFATEVAGEGVSIRLHGKLDAIVESADRLAVYDYKTKEAMSVPAIRGDIASSDGGYFRQLIFYRLLLATEAKGKSVEPALVFIKPDDKGRCPTIAVPVLPEDIERVRGEIKALLEAVWSGDILSGGCKDAKCVWCAMGKLRA